MTEPKKRGRKPRHPIESLKTRVWVEYIKQSVDASTYSVELILRDKPIEPLEKLYRWDKYQNGLHSPKPEYVDFVNQKFSGSKDIYDHVLWDILVQDSLSYEKIDQYIGLMKPEIYFSLVRAVENFGLKRRPFNDEIVEVLINRGEVDCLVVAILMLHESIHLCSPDLRQLALNLYFGLTPKIAAHPLYFKVHPDLFDFIDSTFKHHVFLAPNIRLDMVVFWRAFRDNYWPNDLKVASQHLEEEKSSSKNRVGSSKTRIESLDGKSYYDT